MDIAIIMVLFPVISIHTTAFFGHATNVAVADQC